MYKYILSSRWGALALPALYTTLFTIDDDLVTLFESSGWVVSDPTAQRANGGEWDRNTT